MWLGQLYKVDGKHVVLDYKEREKQVAELLERKLGGEIYVVPRVIEPKNVSTPDYLFRGEKFDLKELSGSSKNLIYNTISKKRKQAENFVLDISKCPLDSKEINRPIEGIYWSRHTGFVDKIIIVKNDDVVSIFCRKS